MFRQKSWSYALNKHKIDEVKLSAKHYNNRWLGYITRLDSMSTQASPPITGVIHLDLSAGIEVILFAGLLPNITHSFVTMISIFILLGSNLIAFVILGVSLARTLVLAISCLVLSLANKLYPCPSHGLIDGYLILIVTMLFPLAFLCWSFYNM